MANVLHPYACWVSTGKPCQCSSSILGVLSLGRTADQKKGQCLEQRDLGNVDHWLILGDYSKILTNLLVEYFPGRNHLSLRFRGNPTRSEVEEKATWLWLLNLSSLMILGGDTIRYWASQSPLNVNASCDQAVGILTPKRCN